MSTKAHCPECDEYFEFPAAAAGKRGRCPAGHVFDLVAVTDEATHGVPSEQPLPAATIPKSKDTPNRGSSVRSHADVSPSQSEQHPSMAASFVRASDANQLSAEAVSDNTLDSPTSPSSARRKRSSWTLLRIANKSPILFMSLSFLFAIVVGGLAAVVREQSNDSDSVELAMGGTSRTQANRKRLTDGELGMLGPALSSDAQIDIRGYMGQIRKPKWSAITTCLNDSLKLKRASSKELQFIGSRMEEYFLKASSGTGVLAQANLVPVEVSIDKLLRSNTFEEMADRVTIESDLAIIDSMIAFERGLRAVQWEAWQGYVEKRSPMDGAEGPIQASVVSIEETPSFEEHPLYKVTPLEERVALRLTNASNAKLRNVIVGIEPYYSIDGLLLAAPILFYKPVWASGESVELEDELVMRRFDGVAVFGVKQITRESSIAMLSKGVKLTTLWSGAPGTTKQTFEFADWMPRCFKHLAARAAESERFSPRTARACQSAAFQIEELAKAQGTSVDPLKGQGPREVKVLTLGGKKRDELRPPPRPLTLSIDHLRPYDPNSEDTWPIKHRRGIPEPLFAPGVDVLDFVPGVNSREWGFFGDPKLAVMEMKKRPGWLVLSAAANTPLRNGGKRSAPRILRQVWGDMTVEVTLLGTPNVDGDSAGAIIMADDDNIVCAGVRAGAPCGTGPNVFGEVICNGRSDDQSRRCIPHSGGVITVRIESTKTEARISFKTASENEFAQLVTGPVAFGRSRQEVGIFASGGQKSPGMTAEFDVLRVESK